MDYKKKYLKYKLKYLTAKKLYGGSDYTNPKTANEKVMKGEGETDLEKTVDDRNEMLKELARKADEDRKKKMPEESKV
tara:strand:- start:401 stop:634 length:234 start_codon:yes stop_codon:yes gene_type:complete